MVASGDDIESVCLILSGNLKEGVGTLTERESRPTESSSGQYATNALIIIHSSRPYTLYVIQYQANIVISFFFFKVNNHFDTIVYTHKHGIVRVMMYVYCLLCICVCVNTLFDI